MTKEKLEEIIKEGEGLEVEFKSAVFELNKDTFDSICGFLNRMGGHLLLGVKDNGKIEGVLENCVSMIVNNIITSANNPQKLNPPFYLSPEVFEVEGKKVIYVRVPESSLVHSTNGKIFVRNSDGDFDITRHTDQVTQLYIKKQVIYTENRVFPFLKLHDFKPEVLKRIRMLAQIEKEGHPWLSMTDAELMRSAGLFKRDPVTNKEGYTLAGVLLLGKDLTIQNVLPHHRTDAILRKENLDRYDDRDDIRTNLVDSYDRLMAFIAKHLPDKFYLDGDTRTSLRDRLFREVVSNLLIHREFSNGFPAKIIIESDRVYSENWSRPNGGGVIDPEKFSPFPKNPVIAKFFHEIGRVDELGSGVRNTFKYSSIYTPGSKPEFIEGDIFKTIIPLMNNKKTIALPTYSWEEVRRKLGDRLGEKLGNRLGNKILGNKKLGNKRLGNKLGDRLGKYEWDILEKIWTNPNISISEMALKIGISTTAIENNINKLKTKNILERKGTARKGYWKILVELN